MLHSRFFRLSVAALAATASLGTLAVTGLASPAYAGTKIKCTTITGNGVSTIVLSGCNGNTGGSSLPLTAATLLSGGKLTWVNGKYTKVKTTAVEGPLGACAAGDTEYNATGTVKADTTGSAPVGGAVKASVCVDANLNISEEPGTTFQMK
jgi:hypothetical protein